MYVRIFFKKPVYNSVETSRLLPPRWFSAIYPGMVLLVSIPLILKITSGRILIDIRLRDVRQQMKEVMRKYHDPAICYDLNLMRELGRKESKIMEKIKNDKSYTRN